MVIGCEQLSNREDFWILFAKEEGVVVRRFDDQPELCVGEEIVEIEDERIGLGDGGEAGRDESEFGGEAIVTSLIGVWVR